MSDILIQAAIGVLRLFMCVYDIVTFVPYYAMCRPDKKFKHSKRIKAKSVTGDPGGPYRATDNPGDLTTSLYEDCETLDDLFLRAVQSYGPRDCLGTRELLSEEDELQPNGKSFKKVIMGNYNWITFEEVYTKATNFGSGLLAVGQKPRKNCLIFAETKAEWMIAAQACIKYNFPVVTLYATLGPEAIVHGVNQSEVTHVITSTSLLPKFKGIIKDMPLVTHLIYIGDGKTPSFSEFPQHIKLLSMTEVEQIGAIPDNIKTPVTKPKKEDIAVIMYTSGSTGVPKGVLISHSNLMCGMSGQCQKIVGLGTNDVYIGYLPLAHVLELSAEISCLANGTKIGYSTPLTLTDQSSKIKKGSKGDVSVLKPTLMAAVPVIMDRLYKGVWEKVNDGGPLGKALFRFAYDYKMKKIDGGYSTPVLDKIIYKKIKAILGGEIRMMLSGGAPLSDTTLRFMNICFCCPVLQGYGLTETCGAGTITEVSDLSLGRVGAPLFCNEFRLRDWPEGNYTSKDKPYPRGEILVGGGNVTMGYYKMEEKTKEDFIVIDGMRYFCTGDIGMFEEDGCLRIIDRKKDLVKLQTGEYVALGQIESILTMSPLVDQICVYGDSRHSYTVAMIVVNHKHLKALATELTMTEDNVADICKNSQIVKEVLRRVTKYGTDTKLDKWCIPQKIHLCADMWMPDSGLVTDSFKLKRKSLEEHFKTVIANMYK